MEHNAQQANGLQGYTLGHNKFSTWTRAEFEATLGLKMPKDSNGKLVDEDADEREEVAAYEGVEASLLDEDFAPSLLLGSSGTYKTFSTDNLPDSVDWRDEGAVSPIQDQGSCGGCWTFMTNGVVEGAVKIAGGDLVNLSEQQILDCDTESGAGGCSGGYVSSGFEYLMSYFAILESDYPYVSGADGTVTSCQYDSMSKTDIQVSAWNGVTQYDGTQMKAALATGPVGIAINGGTYIFKLYSGGIFSCSPSVCSTAASALDHAVLLVGYGTEDSTEYFILKNSWGTSWGESGYMRIVNEGTGNGESGMFISPVIALSTDAAMTTLAGFSTLIAGALLMAY